MTFIKATAIKYSARLWDLAQNEVVDCGSHYPECYPEIYTLDITNLETGHVIQRVFKCRWAAAKNRDEQPLKLSEYYLKHGRYWEDRPRRTRKPRARRVIGPKLEAMKCKTRDYGETNDCTVIAVAACTGATYEEAHSALEKRGRKDRDGAYIGVTKSAIRDLGFCLTDLGRLAKTARTLTDHLAPGKKYLISYSGHVAGFDGEDMIDWTVGRMHRVLKVWEITKYA